MSSSPPSGGPKRRGLGRGLDALLSSGPPVIPARAPLDDDPSDSARLIEIDPSRVVPNPEQPRTVFHAGDLEALTASVRTHGVLQPIVVERTPDGSHQLIAGERRLRAARAAGLSSIPAILRPASESARQALELALTENLVRADLSPIEEAVAYSRLADTFGLSHEAIAIRVGRSRAAVSNTVRLLSLPAPVQTALGEGRITAGHARALLTLTTVEAQEALAMRIETEELTVRDVEREVQNHFSNRPGGSSEPATTRRGNTNRRDMTPDELALERGFEEAVGAPVSIERHRQGGRVVISFHSDEELDGLYHRLGGPPL